MATILPFAIRPRAAVAVRASGYSASVVIFPGVRHEPGKAGSALRSEGASGSGAKRKKST